MLSATTDAKRGEGLLMSASLASRTAAMIDAAITSVEANRSVTLVQLGRRDLRPFSTSRFLRFVILAAVAQYDWVSRFAAPLLVVVMFAL
jgi:hypothetical protein